MALALGSTIFSIFGGVVQFGMLVGIGVSGYEASKEIPKLKEAASNIKKETATLKAKYNAVIQAAGQGYEQFSEEIASSLNDISKYHAQIRLSKQNFRHHYRKIQVYGAIVITTIILILIMKQISNIFTKKVKSK